MTPRRALTYFQAAAGAPPPLTRTVEHRVQMHEVDLLGVVWHGHYPALFEEASTEVRRDFGLGYAEFAAAGCLAPIVQIHVDFHRPLHLDDLARVTARLWWNEGARLDIEYEILRPDGRPAATGYTVQMFIDRASREPCLAPPPLLLECWARWRAAAGASRA